MDNVSPTPPVPPAQQPTAKDGAQQVQSKTHSQQQPQPQQQPQKPQQPQQQQQPQSQFSGFLAEIVEVKANYKTGIYGEIYLVSCRILEGKDKGRIIRRSLLGPAKKGDIIRLPETSKEAKEIRVK